jgi:uncharacterized membrane protein
MPLLHPKLVQFPIALAFSAMGMQVLGMVFKKETWRAAAWLMFVLATLALPVVALSGWLEADRLHLHHPVLEEHKWYAFTATGSSLAALIVLWFLKSRNSKLFQLLFLAALLGICFLLFSAGREGGEMVFEYGVGVSR